VVTKVVEDIRKISKGDTATEHRLINEYVSKGILTGPQAVFAKELVSGGGGGVAPQAPERGPLPQDLKSAVPQTATAPPPEEPYSPLGTPLRRSLREAAEITRIAPAARVVKDTLFPSPDRAIKDAMEGASPKVAQMLSWFVDRGMPLNKVGELKASARDSLTPAEYREFETRLTAAYRNLRFSRPLPRGNSSS
jgi:hypothetical protein